MRTLFDGSVYVHYGQIYVVTGDDYPDMRECFGGQRNGLCGAAVPGQLFLITGLHTGDVGFAVEVHDSAPPVDDSWEEIVEASLRPAGPALLMQWAGEETWPLDLSEVDYRVRYSATRMQEGRDRDTTLDGEPLIDRYLLQFWPAPLAPDEVIKRSSQIAEYWHGVARETPPPPTPEEKAEAKRLAELEKQRQREERALRREIEDWGGSLPSERLRRLRSHALSIARLDRPFVDALDLVGAETQRAVARWVTRRTFVEAQLAGVDWIVPALAAMDRGDSLPPPFGDDRAAWDRLLSDPQVPHTLVTSPDGRTENCLQQAMAFPAIFSANAADPLAAAFEALWAGAVAFGQRHDVLFAEVKEAFPALSTTS